MPKTKISEFSSTPASNTDIDSINIAENCPPSGINDAIRELMAQLKDFQTGAVGDSFNGPVGTTTAAAGAFTTLAASGAVTLSGGTANGVTYLNGSKVVTSGSALTFDGTNFVNGSGGVRAGTNSGSGGALSAWGGSSGATIDITPSTVSGANGVTYNTSFISGGSGPHIFSIGGTESLRLTSTSLYTASGISVGIGTTTPTYKLQIKGSGAQGAVVTSTSGSASLILENFTGSGNYAYIQYNGHSGSGLQFYDTANVTARMTLDSSGNLGLGVTPSAWRSVDRVMQAGSGVSQFGHFVSGGVGAVYGGGFYRDDSGFKYTLTATPAGRFDFNYTTSGGFTWNIAPTGTAGNAITFTQAMTLDASGNLLVGTTSSNLSSASRGVIEVNGASTAYIGLDTGGTLRGTFYSNGSIVGLATATLPLTFGTTGGTEWGRFDTSGNLQLTNSNNIASITQTAITLTGAGGGGTGGQTVNIITANSTARGVLIVGSTQNTSAIFFINATSAVNLSSQTTNETRFSATSGSGNTVNVYVSGANIVLENNIQATRSFYVTFIGQI